MSEIEPFARAVNFSNIGDESETKSEIDEINEIVDARVKKAVEEFRERAVGEALREMIRSKSQEDPEWAQERIANRIRALPAV